MAASETMSIHGNPGTQFHSQLRSTKLQKPVQIVHERHEQKILSIQGFMLHFRKQNQNYANIS